MFPARFSPRQARFREIVRITTEAPSDSVFRSHAGFIDRRKNFRANANRLDELRA